MSEVKRIRSRRGQPRPARSSRRSRGRRSGPNRLVRSPAMYDLKDSRSVVAPVALARVRRTQRPQIVTRPNGDCAIVHREYFADLKASGDGSYRVDSYAINPGQDVMFPWLSKIAANYESYQFGKLDILYETEASTNIAGTVVLTVDYDAQDDPPADKTQALSYRSTVRSPPWAKCSHRSLAEDLKKSKSNYVRVGAQPNGTDIKTYDIGNFFAITQGCPNDQLCGELYVEYSVLLMTPVFENAAANGVAGGHILGNGTMSDDNPFGDGVVHEGKNTVGFTMNGASSLLCKQPGEYWFTVNYVGVGINDIMCNRLDLTVDVFPIWFVQNATNEVATALFHIIVRAPGVVSFDNTGELTTITAANLYIGQIPRGSA